MGGMAHEEFWDAITMLAYSMTNQINQGAQAPHAPTPFSRVRNITRMNPPEFHECKVDEDPQEFIDEVYKMLSIMGVRSEKKAELAAYQLKGVAQIWFTQWKVEKGNNNVVFWEEFKVAFLNRFFSLELKETWMMEFMNIKQGSMSVREYALKFNQLSKYAPQFVAELRSRKNKFMSGVSEPNN